MSYITPRTNIYLYSNCPLPSNYEHTFYFDTLQAQSTYFSGLNPTLYNNNTYQVMSSGVVRIKDSIDNLYDKSYMSFVNTKTSGVGFENKTYYCFVTDVIYINNGTTEIHYTIDVMQTYLFQYKTGDGLGKKMFVDRSHISKADDVLSNGVMMNDEGLDVGIDMQCDVVRRNAPELRPTDYGERGYVAYVFSSGQLNNPSNTSGNIPNNLMPTEVEITDGDNNTFRGIAVKTPENDVYYYMNYPFGTYESSQKDKYIVSPLYCQEIPIYKADGTYATNASSGINNFSGLAGLYNYIRLFNALGKIDAIQKIIMVPGWMCYKNTISNNRLKDPYGSEIETSISFTTTFGSYTPKNKKLLCYPYNYYTVDNNSSESKVYKPQLFDNPETNDINFKYFGSIHYGEIWCYPLYYYTKTNEVQQQVYGLSKKVGVELPYINDSYSNWLANSTISRNLAIDNHKITSALSIATSILGDSNTIKTGDYQTGVDKKGNEITKFIKSSNGTTNIGTGGFVAKAAGTTLNAMSNSLNFITGLVQQKAEHAEIPTTLAGTFSENLGYIIDITGFTISRVRVTNSVAKRIDNYFSVYGYKIMDWQVPKLKVRSNWTFIKTAGCAIKPNNIPAQFEDAINKIFDNGITFWANTANFMNYGDFSNPDPS